MILIAYILLCLIWGSTWMFIKIGLDSFSPMTFAAVRFVLTAILMLLMLFFINKKLTIKKLICWPAIWFGIFNGIAYAFVFVGENKISSSLTAVLNGALPFFTFLFAAIFIGERVTFRKLSGLSLGFIGIFALYWKDLSEASVDMIFGGALIILSTITYAAGSVIAKKHPTDNSILEVVTTQMVVSGVVLTILALIFEPYPTLIFNEKGVIALLYLSIIGTVAAFLLNYYLLRNIDVSRLSYVSMVTPVVAVALGVIFLDETLSVTYFWTLLAVISGMYIMTT